MGLVPPPLETRVDDEYDTGPEKSMEVCEMEYMDKVKCKNFTVQESTVSFEHLRRLRVKDKEEDSATELQSSGQGEGAGGHDAMRVGTNSHGEGIRGKGRIRGPAAKR